MMNRLDQILNLLQERSTKKKVSLEEVQGICNQAREVLKGDPLVINVKSPIFVVGDLHGQFYDLLEYLHMGGNPPQTSYLFLGDYVDRGENSIETFLYLLILKIKYPKNIWMLRGNHEAPELCRYEGFYDECCKIYKDQGPRIFALFVEVFRWLPLIAIISDRIFCVHGGISPSLGKIEDLKNIPRPLDIPGKGMITDILWADPSTAHSGYKKSDRGTSYTFGDDVAQDFLKKHDFDLICRAHQLVENGYEFPFLPSHSVLTIFSAPNYCDQFQNKGAMMFVDQNLKCSFVFIQPFPFTLRPRAQTIPTRKSMDPPIKPSPPPLKQSVPPEKRANTAQKAPTSKPFTTATKAPNTPTKASMEPSGTSTKPSVTAMKPTTTPLKPSSSEATQKRALSADPSIRGDKSALQGTKFGMGSK